MKVIVSIHYNRPYYTQRCVAALEQAVGIDEYVVYFHIDPGCDKVIDIINQSKLNKEIYINKVRRGYGHNILHAFIHGFSVSDYVIVVEDDIVLAHDALLYFEYANKFRQNQKIFSVTAYNRAENMPIESDYFKVNTRQWYHGWGVAFWIDRWQQLLVNGCRWSSIDTYIIDNFIKNTNRHEVFPVLSRCQNIGILNGRNQHNATIHRYADRIHLNYWRNNVLSKDIAGEFHE